MDDAGLEAERATFREAASGGLSAIIALRDACYGARSHDDILPLEALTGAEMFARLAAAHGRTEDLLQLSNILLFRADGLTQIGQNERARSLGYEALSILLDLWRDGRSNFFIETMCEMDPAQGASAFWSALYDQFFDELPADAAVAVRDAARPVSVH